MSKAVSEASRNTNKCKISHNKVKRFDENDSMHLQTTMDTFTINFFRVE